MQLHPGTEFLPPPPPDGTDWRRFWLNTYPCDVPSLVPYPRVPLGTLLEQSARRFPGRRPPPAPPPPPPPRPLAGPPPPPFPRPARLHPLRQGHHLPRVARPGPAPGPGPHRPGRPPRPARRPAPA